MRRSVALTDLDMAPHNTINAGATAQAKRSNKTMEALYEQLKPTSQADLAPERELLG